jgi:hypothetical protein
VCRGFHKVPAHEFQFQTEDVPMAHFFAVRQGLAAWFLLAAAAALAQAPNPTASFPTQFPEASVVPGAEELAAVLKGRVFKARFASTGLGLRYDFRDKFVYVNLSNGAKDTAVWRAESGRLCVEFVGPFTSGCAEARVKDGVVYIQRTVAPGEVFALTVD